MYKKEARDFFLNKRLQLTQEAVKEKSKKIFEYWLKSKFNDFNQYHIFLSIKSKNEVDTSFIINYLWEKQKQVFSPKVFGNDLLHFKLTPETQLKENLWGIAEPVNSKLLNNLNNLDVVFVPLLVADKQGNRVGYGKGYYDKFLSNHLKSYKIGLSFYEPIDKIEDSTVTDIPLDYLLFPSGFIQFSMLEK